MTARPAFTISAGGEPTHELLVPMYAFGRQWEPKQLVRYDGPMDWKFAPLDAEERKKWLADHYDGERVRRELRRKNGKYAVPPAGTPFDLGSAGAAFVKG